MDAVAPVAISERATLPVPVAFRNQEGMQLIGVYHEGAGSGAVAILLLSPGVKMRVAPHRLYNKMASRFVALGFPVFRFDFHGLGDSQGEAGEELLADLYRATQCGRYVDDTVAAMDWVETHYGISRFIVAGLCGGALTGLLTAEIDSRIIGLIGLSIPVILDGSMVDAVEHMTAPQLARTRQGYLGKLRIWRADAWRSWVRLITLQSDFQLLVRSFRTARGTPDRERAVLDNTNPKFAPAFLRMVGSARPILLIFAESDRLYAEFEAKFLRRHASELARYESHFRVHVTPHANHVFSFAEWQRDLLDVSCRWLEQAVGTRREADQRP